MHIAPPEGLSGLSLLPIYLPAGFLDRGLFFGGGGGWHKTGAHPRIFLEAGGNTGRAGKHHTHRTEVGFDPTTNHMGKKDTSRKAGSTADLSSCICFTAHHHEKIMEKKPLEEGTVGYNTEFCDV